MNEGAKLVNIDFTMAIQIINFLVLVYIFWRAFAKKIGKVLEDRKKMALSEMEIVENEKAKLEEQKTAITKLKKESKRRANDILIKAERQADERKDQIVSTAMENRDRMMMKAEADIEKMRLNAKFALQKEVGHMAAELAEKIIKENVKDKQDNMIAQRYATAIYEIAKENNKQDEIREILNLLTEKYNEDENFRNFLSNPIVTTEEKEKFLKKAFSFINPESFNIINYLVSKDRMNYISLIRDNYVSFLYKEESKLPVVAIFTKELSEAQKEKLIKKLEKKYGKKIVLNLEIDESIIGGGIIKVGNDVINGSIKHQIEDMKRIF